MNFSSFGCGKVGGVAQHFRHRAGRAGNPRHFVSTSMGDKAEQEQAKRHQPRR
jgi:hypothetical protein